MRGELTIDVLFPADGSAQVRLLGSVDAHTFPRLEQAFADLGRRQVRWLVLDLTELEYISSVGINFLVTARAAQQNQGGDVILVGPQSHIMKIFTMLGLHEVLRVMPSLDAAWVQLTGGPHKPPDD